MIRICQYCGETFETTHPTKKFCDRVHYTKCTICGKTIEVPKGHESAPPTYCSQECLHIIKVNANKKVVPKHDCVCEECGEHFLARSSRARFCNKDHIRKCRICGKDFVVKRENLGRTDSGWTCSWECHKKAISAGLKASDKSFGFGSPEHEAALMKHYGVKNPMQSPVIQQRANETKLERYGDTSFVRTEEYRRKTRETCQARYGSDWYQTSEIGKARTRERCLEKYGVINPSQSPAGIRCKMTDPTKLDNLLAFRSDPKKFIQSHFDHKPTLQELVPLCGIIDSFIGYILATRGLSDLVVRSLSHMEDEVVTFLAQLLPNTSINTRTRQIITPKELDIYLPEYRLGIECNPTSTHNSSVPFFDNTEILPPTYHRDKTNLCEDKGVFLFHIFGYEWTFRKSVCLSMLRNLLGQNSRRVYGRKTEVREVSYNDSIDFLNENHRQGGASSKVRLGLYEGDELVSIMTFGKMRRTIGTGTEDLSDCWELIRFCNLLNTSVIGGASKLFNSFVKIYEPVRVRSFSDRAHTRGTLYPTLGFTEIRRSDPGYVWVDLLSDTYVTRNNTQKAHLQKLLHDPNLDLSKTEVEIMTEHGFVQVFDSGTITWEWRNGGVANVKT